MTDVIAFLDRGAFFRAPFRNSSSKRLLADEPLERGDPGFVLLEQIRRGSILIEVAGLVLLNPDPDQVTTDVMALGEPVKGLAGQNSCET